MNSRLLLPEPALQVLPTLAGLIGLQDAMVLQQVHYLSLSSSNHDGWVAKTLDDWCQVFTFLSRRSVERSFARLRQQRLLMSEPVPGGGRRTRVKVDHDVLDELTDLSARDSEAIRQSGGTNPPDWRDQSARLAGPIRQIGGTRLCKGTEEVKADGTTDAAARRGVSSSLSDQIDEVFEAWRAATGNVDSVLDDKRRRIIRKAIRSRPNGHADCLDAVRGWRHSSYHAGANPDGVPMNSIGLLLGDADHLDRFRNLERIRGASDKLIAGSGKVAAPCPGLDVGQELAELWAPIAAGLAERVPETTHDIWLAPLHPHAELDGGGLIVGVPPEIATWVGDRFRRILDAAAGGLQVTLVECGELVTSTTGGPG